ncbi:uncharacterized protein BP5553_00116 [Venustampulla echinocandica]|uniref:Zn(2)-C6 fungal-type domain-containing protein n=1 Tax=Venustampulla echinocandica TaxID=2656787 RepID=A0A370TX86_9HELO|nr:uncharacterized protein BP5553_00116 [Venustampulla echinocandica]RDL40137.1 hypothetical protein BP5553_00116 [Venustampulla echinocandica]
MDGKQSLTRRKIKCSGDKSGCARCVGLKIKCVYNGVSKSGSRSQSCQSPNSTANIKPSWSIHSPNKTSSSKPRRNEPLQIPQKEKEAIDHAADDELSFTEFSLPSSVSPKSPIDGSSSDRQTTILARTLGPFLYDDSSASINLMTDDPTLGDLDDSLDWALMSDNYAPTPDLISLDSSAFDPSLSPSPILPHTRTTQLQALSTFQPPKSPGPQQPSSTLSSPSAPRPCSCSARLSALLFSLNGHLRRRSSFYSPTSPGGSTISLEQSISRILAAQSSAAPLGDDMAVCASRCLTQASNAVQLVMLIEQLVDLYAGLVEQLSAARYAVDGVQRAPTTNAEMAMAMPVRVGEYMVESAAEREAMITLLVGRRMKALTGFAVTCRERLGSASGAGECRGRLNGAVQRLEMLRDGQNRRC